MPNTVVDSITDLDKEPWLHVVAAVIFGQDGRILLARRPEHKHQGGKWEFPGGKVKATESATVALARELTEELGIIADPEKMEPFLEVRHRYPEKNIFLDIWLVHAFSGEPAGCEGQEIGWFSKQELPGLGFPAANAAILEKLLA